ncbi:hypothetical protein D3C75_1081240 [compost metagenome]
MQAGTGDDCAILRTGLLEQLVECDHADRQQGSVPAAIYASANAIGDQHAERDDDAGGIK